MKKMLTVLLLISAVVGMTVPGMANPANNKDLRVEIHGANIATSGVTQTLTNTGDLVNDMRDNVVGGSATANSGATANGRAEDNSRQESSNGEDANVDTASGNIDSGNAAAFSGAGAKAGDADNSGTKIQANAVTQNADANVITKQNLDQDAIVREFQSIDFDNSPIVEHNNLDDESLILAAADEIEGHDLTV